MNKAVFLDKDGTLIYDVPYNVKPELIRFEKYAFESLYMLQQQGYDLIIISNQPGISQGYFEEKDLRKAADKIRTSLEQNNIKLNGFYFCPHSSIEKCECRKPRPGLILKASEDLHIDLSKSWMIGDILNDVEAGNNSGCKTVLINNGNETEWMLNTLRVPDYVAPDLKKAAEFILIHTA